MNKTNSHYAKISCLNDIHREIETLEYLIEKKEKIINNDINDIKASFNLFSIVKKTLNNITPYISIGLSAAGMVAKLLSKKKLIF